MDPSACLAMWVINAPNGRVVLMSVSSAYLMTVLVTKVKSILWCVNCV
jgi:hypothetical protein